MSDPEAQSVALGRITKPQGLRGQLRLKLYNPESELLWQHADWIVHHGASVRTVQARKVRMLGSGIAVISIDGVSSREAAEQLRGAEVALPLNALPEAEEGEWYVRDLLGLAVVNEQGEPLGRVLDTIPYPSIDCLLIETPKGRFEVPMVEPYLDRVDLAEQRVVVRNISDFDPIPTSTKKRTKDVP